MVYEDEEPDAFDETDERFVVPDTVRHLRETLTEDMAIRAFRCRHGRDLSDEDDLEEFIDQLVVEAYNAEYDEWDPEFLDYD